MNRELKFRAWDSKNKEFCYFNFVDIYEEATISSPYEYSSWSLRNMPKGQYTGLKDKNDKEIYEGDIVTHDVYIHKPVTVIGQIVFFNQNASFMLEDTNAKRYSLASFEQFHYEIIGNIYENQELLEDK
jgi:uncharacterized phage protein (TIGR01671 family)